MGHWRGRQGEKTCEGVHGKGQHAPHLLHDLEDAEPALPRVLDQHAPVWQRFVVVDMKGRARCRHAALSVHPAHPKGA